MIGKESTDKKKDDECSLAPAALIDKLDGKDVQQDPVYIVMCTKNVPTANKMKMKKKKNTNKTIK